MARRPKCRRVCRVPETVGFVPIEGRDSEEAVILTVDEYESIRLIDKEGLSQEQCSERMEVARTTAQKIYETARKKLADALVDGLPLRIEGGSYRLCDGRAENCGTRRCRKQEYATMVQLKKGEHTMRIAVTYENGEIFQHFGHTEAFKVYDVADGAVVEEKVVGTNGSGHGALAEILHALKVDVLICGGIGGGAQVALANAGIKLYGGVSGSADRAVEALLAGKLEFDPNVHCDHHGHEHSEGHRCGSHGCGQHH